MGPTPRPLSTRSSSCSTGSRCRPGPSDRPVTSDDVRLATNATPCTTRRGGRRWRARQAGSRRAAPLIRELAGVALGLAPSAPTRSTSSSANVAVDEDFPDDIRHARPGGRGTLGAVSRLYRRTEPHQLPCRPRPMCAWRVRGATPARRRRAADPRHRRNERSGHPDHVGRASSPTSETSARPLRMESDGYSAITDLDPCILGPVLEVPDRPFGPAPRDLIAGIRPSRSVVTSGRRRR